MRHCGWHSPSQPPAPPPPRKCAAAAAAATPGGFSQPLQPQQLAGQRGTPGTASLQQQQQWNLQRRPPLRRQPVAAAPPPSLGQQQQQRHTPGATPPSPSPPAGYLVVVEGTSDMRAVRRACGADVYVLGTSTAADSPGVLQELRGAVAGGGRYRGLLVLMDPDVAGRQARGALDAALPPGCCLHAFLPAPLATAAAATKYHEPGNVGVEHAAPQHIAAALAAPRRSDPQRRHFTREQLTALGLVAELHARGGDVTARRSLVCACLGLGDCDGKQLLRQLDRYGFAEEELQGAVRWAGEQLAARRSGDGET